MEMEAIKVHNLEVLKELVESELNYRHAKTLHIPDRGMYLPSPHARLIFNKHKTVILKDRKFNIVGIPFLYCDKEYAYGVIELGKPKEIKNEGQFKATQRFHRVTEDEFKKWHWTLPIYAYPIKKVHNFKEPIRINLPTGVQNFFRNPIQYLETGEYPFTAKHSLNLSFPIEVTCSNCGNWIYVPHAPMPSQCPHCGVSLMETEETKSRMTPLPKEEYERIYKDYPNRPLPKKYYKDQRGGVAWCLSSPKTKILTQEGWKPWHAIQVGDKVLTHRGRYKKVTRKDVFENVLKWVKVEFQFDDIEKLRYSTRVTENHPFLTKDGWKGSFTVPQYNIKFLRLDLNHIHDYGTNWQTCHANHKGSVQFEWYVKQFAEPFDGYTVTIMNANNPDMRRVEEGIWDPYLKKSSVVITGSGYYAEKAVIDDVPFLNTSLIAGDVWPDAIDPKAEFSESIASYILLTVTDSVLIADIKTLDGKLYDRTTIRK